MPFEWTRFTRVSVAVRDILLVDSYPFRDRAHLSLRIRDVGPGHDRESASEENR